MTTPFYSPIRISLGVLLLLFAGFPLLVLATGANQEPFLIEQPDGTTFWARNWGDEWRNGTETLDGYTIQREKGTGRWVYATRDFSGNLVPSQLLVGRDRPLGMSPHMRARPPQKTAYLLRENQRLSRGAQRAPPTAGTHRLLVIVVDFTPSASLGSTELDWEQHFFTGGGTYSPRSVKQYWSAASYGLIDLEPAAESFGRANNGVVFVTLSYPHPDPVDIDDQNRQIARDAILAANNFVNFASFDTNGDGYLNTNELHVYTIVRGYEKSFGVEAICTGNGGVWAHRFSLGFASVDAPSVDGVIVGHFRGAPIPGPFQGGYSQEGEWHCRTPDHAPGHKATIGVSSHELGHDMGTGLPDLYDRDDTVGTHSSGIGEWGVMGSGNWAGGVLSGHSGTHPILPSPWSRWFLGFLTPTEITSTQTVSFPQVETASGSSKGVFRVLPNPGGIDWDRTSSGTGEYFLLENRQRVGDFDVALPGDGLLVWHIDESVTNDGGLANADEGTSPPGNPRLVVLEQADGRFDLECYDNPPHASLCNPGDGSDPWKVGTATAFTDSSTPNSRFYSGNSSGVSITNISASGTTMTALLTPGDASPPNQGTIFEDDMESGANGWAAQAPWSLTTALAHSPTHSLTDSPAGNYANDANVSVWSPTLSFSGRSSVTLTLWHRYDLETSFDFGQVWVTTDDGQTFTNLTGYTGTNNTWTQATVDLTAFAGQPTVRIIFQLLSDGSITRDGWYIDDVVVTGTPVQASLAISTISPSSITLVQGGNSQQVSISLSRTNYTGNVTLSLSGLPSGVSSSINQPGSGNSGSIILQAASTASVVSGRTVTVIASGSDVPSAQATFSLNVTQPSPVPAANLQTIIPHSASGGGFLSRLFIKNMSSAANALTINRISQAGSIVRSTTTTLQARGTLLIADSESTRTRDLTVEWFGIGSERPISASVLFDFDSQSLGLQENFRTAVAALGADSFTNFAFPVRVATSEVTVGLALANPNGGSNTIALSLLNGNGSVMAQDTIVLAGFAQTAFSLQDRSAFRNIVLGVPEFIGSLEVSSSQPVAAMVIGNNFRELFSLPVASGLTQ